MQVHEKIRSFREQRKWSQEEMAEKLNLSVSGYAKIEQGKTNPNLERLLAIADVLGVEMIDLMPDSDNNMICLINEGDLRQGHSFYNGNQGLLMEVEKLQLQLQHAKALLDEKDLIINQLKSSLRIQQEMLELIKNNT